MSNEGNPLCPRKQAVMSTGGKLLCPTGCERVSRQPSMSYRFRTFSTKKCVPSESRQPLEIKGSGGFQNGLMFQPHPESLVVGTSNAWWHGSVGRAHRSHRWGRWFESNCHHHESGRRSSSTLTGFFCVPLKGTHFSKSGVRTFLSEGYAKRVRSSPENCVPLEAFRSHPS